MKTVLFIIFLFSIGSGFAQNNVQKSPINFEAIGNWPSVSRNVRITNDGKYVAYGVENGSGVIPFIIIATTDGTWSRKIHGYNVNELTQFIDNKVLIYGNDKEKFQVSLPNGKIRPYVDAKIFSAPNSIKTTVDTGVTTIYLYDKFKKGYLKLTDDRDLQLKRQLKIDDVRLLGSGALLLSLNRVYRKKNIGRPIPNAAKVEVWSYLDSRLQSEQKANPEEPQERIIALYFPLKGKFEVLEDEKYTAIRAGDSEVWLLARKSSQVKRVGHWNVRLYKAFDYAISTHDGKRRRLPMLDTISTKDSFTATKDGKYIGYSDVSKGHYYSYALETGQLRNLTKLTDFVEKTWDRESRPTPKFRGLKIFPTKFGLIGYDEFDIWQFDLSGKKPTTCITNHFGRKSGIILRLVGESTTIEWSKGEILIYGFGKSTKMNGLFTISIGSRSNPNKIIYDDALYHFPELRGNNVAKLTPLKAKNAQVLLVFRQTASLAPNLFAITKGGMRQLSFVFPEKNYNWMSSELISWKNRAGDSLQGILYKPENFETTKKYPVIINCYEILSDGMHSYKTPSLFAGDVNIPLLVSSGYLVFTPDILYKKGYAGQNALDCVTTGTDEIEKLPYVDRNRIGISGHSFGGFETLYLITHSNRYKAAFAGAAQSNRSSRYNAIDLGDQKAFHNQGELAQGGIGATLWERPDRYIDNSPVFYADKVQTPVLLFHNINDRAVAFSQGIEFFLSMYRLGKPAWLLSYESDQGHILTKEVNRMDFTIRVMQFFDHYLKDKPAPLWMLDGIPYREMGINQAYELDTTGRTPGPSLTVDKAEYKKIDEYSKIPFSEKLKRLTEINE